jgi:acyl carrier protein
MRMRLRRWNPSPAPPLGIGPPASLSALIPRIWISDVAPIGYSRKPMPSPDVGIEAEVVSIVKRVSRQPVEPMAESDLALDLGFDSMRVFELIAALEDRFDVSIPLNDIETIRTVAQVGEYLRHLIARQAGCQ